MINQISDFMAWLGGAEKTILQQVPHERARFVQMAGILLTTACIAVISMIFALHDGVKVPLFPSLLLGFLWGLIIINLDRFLVLSMSATRDLRTLVLMTLPRLALAIVLALVISTPLVLRIFASDIDAQLYTMQLQRSQQQQKLEASSKEQHQLDQIQAQISADQAILNGRLPATVTSPELQAAQAQVSKLLPQAQGAYQAEIAAREAWQCELDGQNCANGSGHVGNGPRAQAKYQVYQQAIASYKSTETQLKSAQSAEQVAQAAVTRTQQAAISRYQNQAKQSLPQLQQQYSVLQASIQNESAHGSKANQADTGLLAQLQALSDASGQNAGLEVARLTVLALFFLIEILPVTVKFLLNLGPLSHYETVVQIREEELIKETRLIERRKSQTRINVVTDMEEKQESLGKDANMHVAREMTDVLNVALRQWSDQVHARLSGGGLTGASGSTGNGVPPPREPEGPTANGVSPAREAESRTPNGTPLTPDVQVNSDFELPDGNDL